jgi:hypothetical protein
MRPTLRKDAAGYAKKDAPLRRTLPFTSNEPSYGHFELLMAVEEGARPVIIPIANPPTAPARIPIRTRNFAFSRMRVLCLTGGPPNYASAQILSQFLRRKELQTNEILKSVCGGTAHRYAMRFIRSKISVGGITQAHDFAGLDFQSMGYGMAPGLLSFPMSSVATPSSKSLAMPFSR